MSTNANPLFPDQSPQDGSNPSGNYVLPSKVGDIQPTGMGANAAANLIKEKIAHIYAEAEPNAQIEAAETAAAPVRSVHQEFMHQLSTSGKSLAEIQTAWHNYYVSLPDSEKHAVWQEFYAANNTASLYTPPTATHHTAASAKPAAHKPVVSPQADSRKPNDIRRAIRHQVQKRTAAISPKHKQNLHSLLFGLSTGFIVLLIFMFGFFNEVIIAPFIQPGRATAAPVIVDNSSIAANGKQEVIIPKINLELPVVYNLPGQAEAQIMEGLHHGVVHYPSTELPGQKGNAVFFGHSSSNILSTGRYKFAFVLLHKLQKDDVFYLTYKSKVYAYKVIVRKVVEPTQVDVLNDVPGQTATATLITCDPPGTSLRRLVLVGQQISPNPAGNTIGSTNDTQNSQDITQLTGKEPTLLSRFWNWIF
jgi:sortase A